MDTIRILWLFLIGLLAIFFENRVQSHDLSIKSGSVKKDVTSKVVNGIKKLSKQAVQRNVTTSSRSVTIQKKSTVFKKKCWSDLQKDNETSFNTLDMCRKNGYNTEGLYVVPEFLGLLKTLNRQQVKMASRISYPRDYSLSVKDNDEFDVVIVGCGAAGSALAAKLSDEKDLNILVLEAGGTPSMQSEIPGLWANSIGTNMDWNYHAEADDTFGQSLDGNRVKLVRGKCLSGTTALNIMLYDRGLQEDYMKFEIAGLTKWTWEDVVRYYKRSEDCKFEKIITDETVRTSHSQGGKLSVNTFQNKRTVQIRQVYSQAIGALNYTTSEFHDVKNHRGFVSSVALVDKGLRVNAAKAYLKNANRKYNLKISARSFVRKVLFEGTRAVGVEFENSVGETVRVRSKNYTVLSAGPVGTPTLLMRSGVGPAALLESLGVPMVVDNGRVGQNLQAHPNFMGLVVKFDGQPIRSYSVSEMVYEYLMKYTGPLASIGLCSFTGFIDVDGNGTPDVQIFLYYYSHDDTVFMPSQLDAFNFDDNVTDQLIDLNDDNDIQIVGISLLHPRNTGNVTVKYTGNDGDDAEYEPIINFGSLDEEDVNTLLKAIDWVKKVIKSESLKHFGPTIVPLKFADGPEPDADSESYWRYAIKQLTTMNFQMVGTSSMAVEQSGGVVNEDLEVFGTENFMIVDSSVLPVMFTGESCAPSIMVAEKAADIMKQKLGCHNDDVHHNEGYDKVDKNDKNK